MVLWFKSRKVKCMMWPLWLCSIPPSLLSSPCTSLLCIECSYRIFSVLHLDGGLYFSTWGLSQNILVKFNFYNWLFAWGFKTIATTKGGRWKTPAFIFLFDLDHSFYPILLNSYSPIKELRIKPELSYNKNRFPVIENSLLSCMSKGCIH